MLKKLWLNLQLFADGGDGGDGGSAATTGEGAGTDSGENIPASIPEKAKKYYQKAMAKSQAKSSAPAKAPDTVQTTNEPKATEEKIPYDDLIKSEAYKEDHEAYVKKLVEGRLKKYKGIEEQLRAQRELLDEAALKYGVDPNSENFLGVLREKMAEDDSYYEKYAMDHDMSVEEARRLVTAERRVRQYEAEDEARKNEEQMRQHILQLRQNAERTKARFPQFDLETEMQNEKFRKLCAVNNGDTTAAYMACHWEDVIPAQVQMASRKIQEQTAQAVAANMARPVENGISAQAPSVVQQDFRKMNLQQIRQYAEEQRKKR
ncbi:MAG: hypothetical protein IJB80_05560 [Clostridia bacterium]|nr:hypothetical protein [Clostridia bacterium]